MIQHSFITSIIRSFTFVTISLLFCSSVQSQINAKEKIRGISFLGPQDSILELSMVKAVDAINANWIAAIPEATIDRSTLKLIADKNNPNWSETMEGIKEIIRFAKLSEKKVMLKPQIVLGQNDTPNDLINELASYINLQYRELKDKTYGAKWRGDFVAGSEKDWQQWESSYEQYILNYARLATELDIDLFCIGTELREFVIRRPSFWKALIQKIKIVYQGPLTYSANWDEYDKVTFWKDLDYIGTNAYHPIDESSTPTVEDVFKSWRKIRTQIRKVSQENNRKVIITEYGYRNVSYAGLKPWLHDEGTDKPNYDAQSNLYEAFFKSLWNESWITGGFGWNWIYKEQVNRNTDFSVQGKPALDIVVRYYQKKDN